MENCASNSGNHKDRQKGNVLFLILIAVALFAALSYAVTKSTNSGGANSSQEKGKTKAAQFAQYGAAVSAAITKLRTINGCSDTQINFENPLLQHPDFWGGSTNPNSPTDGRCNVFSANGGGMYYWDARKDMPVRSKDEDFLTFTTKVNVKNVGTDSSDLMMYLVMDGSQQSTDICKAYDRDLGLVGDITSGTTRSLDWSFAAGSDFVYETPGAGGREIGEDPDPSALRGQSTGCLNGSSSHDADSNILYYVLIAR